MKTLKFESKGHVYTLEGKTLPSVTQVIQGAGLVDLSHVSEELLNRASSFGNAVHNATALYDRDELDVFSLDLELEGSVNAWIKFREDTGFVPEIIEKPMYSEKYRFAGTPDRIGTIGKDKVLVDIKSGLLVKTVAIQIAGYEILHPVKRKLAVQLLQDGTYKIAPTKWFEPSDKTVFLSCLNIYNYQKRSKK